MTVQPRSYCRGARRMDARGIRTDGETEGRTNGRPGLTMDVNRSTLAEQCGEVRQEPCAGRPARILPVASLEFDLAF
jgi:hypothetical protein